MAIVDNPAIDWNVQDNKEKVIMNVYTKLALCPSLLPHFQCWKGGNRDGHKATLTGGMITLTWNQITKYSCIESVACELGGREPKVLVLHPPRAWIQGYKHIH